MRKIPLLVPNDNCQLVERTEGSLKRFKEEGGSRTQGRFRN